MNKTATQFNHYDDDYAEDPYPILEELRKTCPVAHSDEHGGFWVVTRFDDIMDVLHRPEVFSNAKTSVPPDVGFGDMRVPPLQLDPPEHTPIKRLLSAAFTPARIAPLEPMVRKVVGELIDGLRGREYCDASDEFARIVPMSVMCHLFGLSPEDDRFVGWIRRMLELNVADPGDGFAAAAEAMQYIYGLLMERKVNPGDDLISYLGALEVDGELLSDTDAVLSCLTILGAGIDTTWNTLASTLHYLAQHPEVQQTLRADPSLMATAREEFLRVFAPVTSARQVTGDVELEGQHLCGGDMVLVSFPSANRDPAAFERPDEVVLERQPNRHLTFGGGAHRCLGANLARMEFAIAIEEFLVRLPEFQLDSEASIEWTRGPMHGPHRLPIMFSKSGDPST